LTRGWLSTKNSEEIEWKEWLILKSKDCIDILAGEESVNMSLSWYCGYEQSQEEITSNNYTISEEHHGLFSKGVYFTNKGGFREINRNKNRLSKSTKDKEGETPIFLNWVLMGNIYPVTESPSGSHSLAGKSIRKSYDSHYVLVTEKNDSFSPFKPKTEESNYHFDFTVVSNIDQILPRYAVYYTNKSSLKLSQKVSKYIAWIDSDKKRTKDIFLQFSKIIGSHFLIFSSISSFKSWLIHESGQDKSKCYIVCSSTVNSDETAGFRLCHWLKSSPQFQICPFILLCQNPSDSLFIQSSFDDMVFVMDNEANILEYLKTGLFTHSGEERTIKPVRRNSMKKTPSIVGFTSNIRSNSDKHFSSPRSAITLPSPPKKNSKIYKPN